MLFLSSRGRKLPGSKRKRVSVSLQQNKNTHPHERRSLKELESKSNRDVQPVLSSALSQHGYFRRPKAPSQPQEMVESGKMVDY